MPTSEELQGLAGEIGWNQPEGSEAPSEGPSDEHEDTGDALVYQETSDDSPPPSGDAPAPPPSSPGPDSPKPIVSPSADVDRIRVLEQEKQQLEIRQDLQQIETAAVSMRDQLIRERGMSQDNANESARNWMTAKQRELYDQYRDGSNRDRDKELLAYKLSSETGTPVDELLKYDDPTSMRAHATNRSTSSAEVQTLRKEVQALKKAQQAPFQTYDSGGGSGSAPTLERKVRDYALRGGKTLTRAEYDEWKDNR